MPLALAVPSSPNAQIGFDLICSACRRGYMSDVDAYITPGLPCPGCAEDSESTAIAAEAKVILRAAPRWAWAIIDETLFKDAYRPALSPDLRYEIYEAIIGMEIAEDDQSREPVSRQDVVTRLEALGYY